MMKQKKGNDYLPHQADYDQEETHNHFQQQLCMTEEDDPDVRAKQELINKEILEKGHAPQDFEYYLQKIKCK